MAIQIPQVREASLPQTTGVQTPSADAFGAGVGQATSQLGSTVGNIALDIQNRRNENMTRDLDTSYTQELTDLKDGYEQQNGQVAFDTQPEYDAAVRDLRRRYLDKTDNQMQSEMLTTQINRKETAALAAGSAHAYRSLKTWDNQALGAQLVQTQQQSIKNFGTPQGDLNMAEGMEVIEDLASTNGWPPEKLEAEKFKYRSQINIKAVEDQLVNNPFGAGAILAANQDDIDPTLLPALRRQVKAYTDKQLALNLSDNIMAQAAGDHELAWELTKRIPDREQRLEAQRLVQSDIRMQQVFERKSKEDMQEQVWNGIYDKGDTVSAKDLPPTGTVSPQARAQMEKHIEATQQGVKDIAGNEVEYNKWRAMAADDPAKFQEEFKPSEHRAELNSTQLNSLIKLQEGDEKEIKVQTSRAELYKRGFAGANIKNPKGKAAAEFTAGLDNALLEATERKGKVLNSNEQNDVLNRHIYQKRIDDYNKKSVFMRWVTNSPLYFETQAGEEFPEAIVEKVVSDFIVDEDRIPEPEEIQERLDYTARRNQR